ncbi:putative adhesin [Rickettsiella endosymbiont of Dermanyssus gallinae]|uniref:putative adhesin n=1 Tax=Rickettsiella endosymbiont of Dermanyssus gallinae TaxID=2856608 RepID=UPI001C53338A|nr:hypothetical protein [Rickettsiella endosymbiont of Dermanyssus gallinae]
MSNNKNNNTNFTPVAGCSAFFSANYRPPEAEGYEASRQDRIGLGDVVDGGVFKELYPKLERDETTGERARVISEVSALPDMQEREGRFNLDVIAVEEGVRDVNGEKQGAYVFTTQRKRVGEENIGRIVVDAHGAFKVSVRDEIILQPEMPTVTFLGPHGKILLAHLNHIHKPYAAVSAKGITLMSKQAMNDFNAFGYERITGTPTIGAIRNYELGKNKEEEEKTLNPQQGKHYFESVVAFMHLGRKVEKVQKEGGAPRHKIQQAFDMIELRKKGPRLSARDMVKIAQERGYAQIIFSFCRSPLQKGFKRLPSNTYRADSTEQLKAPVFYSWDEVKKLEIDKGRVLEHEAELAAAPRMRP